MVTVGAMAEMSYRIINLANSDPPALFIPPDTVSEFSLQEEREKVKGDGPS
jgi:hypothetical protein